MSYFQFKQFTVHQDRCAMKVCTDACLFGAWVKDRMRNEKFRKMLDIGTGTGLLSLMLAQDTDILIDAVEIDTAAAKQAEENFAASPWHARLSLVNADIRVWEPEKKYELVISNPPFFRNDLKSADPKRNLALHGEELELKELFPIAKAYLSDHGQFALLLPYHRREESIRIAKLAGLYPSEIMDVKQTDKHGYFRSMLWFKQYPGEPVVRSVTIKNGNEYSAEFVWLLKAYYLHL